MSFPNLQPLFWIFPVQIVWSLWKFYINGIIILHSLLSLIFILHNVSLVIYVVCSNSLIPFWCRVLLHCIESSHFIHLLWWTKIVFNCKLQEDHSMDHITQKEMKHGTSLIFSLSEFSLYTKNWPVLDDKLIKMNGTVKSI